MSKKIHRLKIENSAPGAKNPTFTGHGKTTSPSWLKRMVGYVERHATLFGVFPIGTNY